MSASNSYEKCSCQEDCYAFDTNENEPCWGDVQAIDEIEYGGEYDWVHSCRGHRSKYDGGKYEKEITNENKMQSAQERNDFKLLVIYSNDKRYRDLGLNLETIEKNPKSIVDNLGR